MTVFPVLFVIAFIALTVTSAAVKSVHVVVRGLTRTQFRQQWPISSRCDIGDIVLIGSAARRSASVL